MYNAIVESSRSSETISDIDNDNNIRHNIESTDTTTLTQLTQDRVSITIKEAENADYNDVAPQSLLRSRSSKNSKDIVSDAQTSIEMDREIPEPPQEEHKIVIDNTNYIEMLKNEIQYPPFLISALIIHITGAIYPFNHYENTLRFDFGIIPVNIQFILANSASSFFMFAGFTGFFIDYISMRFIVITAAIVQFIAGILFGALLQRTKDVSFIEITIDTMLLSISNGMLFISFFVWCVKKIKYHVRGSLIGFCCMAFILGSITVIEANEYIFGLFLNDNVSEGIYQGRALVFKSIWTAILTIGIVIVLHNQKVSTPKFKYQFTVHNDILHSMKRFKTINFWLMICLGICLLCTGCVPVTISVIAESFGESKEYVIFYRNIISIISAIVSLVTGIIIDLTKKFTNPTLIVLISIVFLFCGNLLQLFFLYDTIIFSLSLNAIGYGIFIVSYLNTFVDTYGTKNLGINLGILFLLFSLIYGGLLNYQGQQYVQTINDNDVKCNGETCFKPMLSILQGLISISLVFNLMLKRRTKNKAINNTGEDMFNISVKYASDQAKYDYWDSKQEYIDPIQSNLIGNQMEWKDNSIAFPDEQTYKAYNNARDIDKIKTQFIDVEMQQKIHDNKQIIFGSEMGKKIYEAGIKKHFQNKKNKIKNRNVFDDNISPLNDNINDDESLLNDYIKR